MAEPVVRAGLTAIFLDRLAAIESFLTEADAASAYDRLLGELRTSGGQFVVSPDISAGDGATDGATEEDECS